MATRIDQERNRWVEERMARIAPADEWEPNAEAARTRLQNRLSARRPATTRAWLPRAATAVVVCIVLLFAIPTTRALTRQLWWKLTMQKVEVVQTDFQKLQGIWLVPQMMEKKLEAGEESQLPPVVDFQEAVRRAGFTPRLPREGTPPGDPTFMAFPDPMVWSTTISVPRMESVLREAGVNDQPIPKEWDGIQLNFTTRSAVSAVWDHGEMALFQHPLITLSPDGFDVILYWATALRAAGVDRWQAQRLADRMGTAPTLLLNVAMNKKKAIREIQLRAGTATLIEDLDGFWGGGQVTLIWSVSDRMYHLSARSRQQAITAANSIE
jgi:hypothetical protein